MANLPDAVVPFFQADWQLGARPTMRGVRRSLRTFAKRGVPPAPSSASEWKAPIPTVQR
jgi:hypothetical protein